MLFFRAALSPLYQFQQTAESALTARLSLSFSSVLPNPNDMIIHLPFCRVLHKQLYSKASRMLIVIIWVVSSIPPTWTFTSTLYVAQSIFGGFRDEVVGGVSMAIEKSLRLWFESVVWLDTLHSPTRRYHRNVDGLSPDYIEETRFITQFDVSALRFLPNVLIIVILLCRYENFSIMYGSH